jgi:FAD/FMN-containing dehydrogenase/Fe-S oxidoreductase
MRAGGPDPRAGMTASAFTRTTEAELEADLLHELEGEVRFDPYTRHLFSTDASMYAIEPIGVVFPRHADDMIAAVNVAGRFDVPVLPRGAGTSHCGQTVGRAVVLDCSRHMTEILELSAEARLARVQPGVIQDDLNRAAAVHGLMFPPDTSTSNRATLGGMIGNNSCGSRSARYGMTIDWVEALNVILSDASVARLEPVEPEEIARRAAADTLEGRLYRELPPLLEANKDAIATGFPSFWRRAGGYRLDRLSLEGPFDLAKFVVGSEGTLVAVTEATVSLEPLPRAKAVAVGHFTSTAEAVAATSDAMDCGAAAVELVDRFILDLGRSSGALGKAKALLEGDPSALLIAEFYADTAAEARAGLERLEASWLTGGHAYAVGRALSGGEQRALSKLRKAGLGLLMAAGKGAERSLAFVEDTAVDPRRLPDYTERFAGVLDRHGLRAGFYGHASAGCLHIRPFMDLTRPGEIEVMRAVAEEIRDLVVEFGGANSSEHGDGLVRSEFNRHLFGDRLYETMRRVKAIFDPNDRMNPGKIVDAPAMTDNLRDPALQVAPPLVTHFDFAPEGGMRAAANRCMRIGACRKGAAGGGTMCPSYMATRDEQHSTRGRANALVKALSSSDPRVTLADERLHEILDLCLECKACKSECPLSIDMATMKSEFLAHYYERHGVPLRARLFANVRSLYRVGSVTAPLSNRLGGWKFARVLLERYCGVAGHRPLPRFERPSLPTWFHKRPSPSGAASTRGEVIFLADSFTSYTEPEIGRAAIELLEAAGWDVRLVGDVCCGRPAISKGLLGPARTAAEKLVGRLAPWAERGVPIVGCEPSCVLTLADEHLRLLPNDGDAAAVARQTRLVDELLIDAFEDGDLKLDPGASVCGRRILLHAHCHQKASNRASTTVDLLDRLPGSEVQELDAGCCGMAGSFGFEREHYDLSMQIGALRLFPAVDSTEDDTLIAATGISCRQQIAHGTGRRAYHPVELIHAALEPGR